MTVDINFDSITLAVFAPSGRMLGLKRIKTLLGRILTYRIWVERMQKRYARSWKFTKGVRRAIERHGERIRSIAWGYAHKVGDGVSCMDYDYVKKRNVVKHSGSASLAMPGVNFIRFL